MAYVTSFPPFPPFPPFPRFRPGNRCQVENAEMAEMVEMAEMAPKIEKFPIFDQKNFGGPFGTFDLISTISAFLRNKFWGLRNFVAIEKGKLKFIIHG